MDQDPTTPGRQETAAPVAQVTARLAAARADAEAAAARAEAARAAAEAATARAALLQAELAAASIPVPDATNPGPGPDAATPVADATAPLPTSEPVDHAVPSAEAAGWAEQVRAAYAFPQGTVPLGALVQDGTSDVTVQVGLPLAMMNRHGLVAGATGTGKTRTLQLMTEGLSAAGVPVFVADVKGDLSGLAIPGEGNEKLLARAGAVGQQWQAAGFPVELYTLGGLGTGTPIRTTVTDFGPLLLAKVLGLNATQESSLGLIFHWADLQGLALLDLKDLQATIAHLVSDEGKPELRGIGGLSVATAGVILREIVALQSQGADVFFGEPAFSTADLMRLAPDGRGMVSALQLPAVQDRPALFSTFLMWLLADLFSDLPEVGDVDRPRLVFFFDEAHLLFTDASKDFLAQVVQTVRLIRSKGVGVFFVTQSPKDVPSDVLGQLGNRVQHALRAHTEDDARALRAAARTFPRSHQDIEELLTTLGTGEALVTVLSEKGAPTPVAWTRLRAPQASMEPLTETQARAAVASSTQSARYATAFDRESAYELLSARAEGARATVEAAAQADDARKEAQARAQELERIEKQMSRTTSRSGGASRSGRAADPLDSFLRSAGTVLGREITRTIFGTRRR